MGELISKIEDSCRAEHLSVETRDGRERVKSLAYKITRSKTAIDEVGRGLTDEARKLTERVNGVRKAMTTRMDALRDEIRAPLTAWEEAEDKRKQAIKDRINASFGHRALPASSAALRAIQNDVVQIELDDSWAEFIAEATKAKDAFLRNLAGKIQEAERTEAQQAELEAYRESERKRIQESEERAKLAAEEKAKADLAAKEQAEAAERAKAEAAAKDAKIAELEAQLKAAKQQPLPEPVGVAEEPVAVAEPAIAPVGDNYVLVAEITPVRGKGDEIFDAVFAIMQEAGNPASAAEDLTAALLQGRIPHVTVI